MPTTKLNNGQLPTTISSKTIDSSNTINTNLTKLSVTGGTNGQVLSTNGSGSLSWTTTGVSDGDKGDVTVSSSGATWTIDNGAVSYAKIQDVSATSRLLGRASAGAGAIEEITIGNGLTLTGTTISSNVSTGDKGDITVSNSGNTWTIDNDAVTYAKIQNVSATSRLLGRATAGAGDVEEITIGSGLTLTGTTLSASGGGGSLGAPSIVKTSTTAQSVTNSTTLTNHTQLAASTTDTGGVVGTYIWECALIVSSNAGSQQLKTEFYGGGGGQWYISWGQQTQALQDTFGENENYPINQLNFSNRNLLLFRGVSYFGQFWGFQFRFAQSVSNSNTITVQAGSQLKMWKVA